MNNPVGTGANGTDGGYSPDQTNVSSGGTSGKGAADSSSHRLITGPNSYTDYAAANGGSGGKGGKYSKTIFDVGSIGFAAIKYYYNRSIQCSIGYGGGGGGGCGGYDGLKGGAGGNGQIIISWT